MRTKSAILIPALLAAASATAADWSPAYESNGAAYEVKQGSAHIESDPFLGTHVVAYGRLKRLYSDQTSRMLARMAAEATKESTKQNLADMASETAASEQSSTGKVFAFTEWKISENDCRRGKGRLFIDNGGTQDFMLGEDDLYSRFASKLCADLARLRAAN